MKNILYIILGVFLFTSCEEVPVTVPERLEIETERVILIEELTGVSCPNCPAGSATLEAIADDYKGNVVVVGIHGKFLCDPITKEGAESKYDFRNDVGRFLEEYLRPWYAKPSAYFNRVVDESGDFGNDAGGGEWVGLAEAQLQREQVVDVVINHEYDEVTRELKMTIVVNPLKDLEGNFNMNVMITESHIIDSQIDAGAVIKDYEHNHVLRDMVTAYDGDAFAESLSKGQFEIIELSYSVPPEDGLWVAENLNIVAFVTDLTGSSKEVLQAAEVDLLK